MSIHRPDAQLVNANYWSRLGTDIKYDQLLRDYLEFTMKTRTANPLPTELPMHPKNMAVQDFKQPPSSPMLPTGYMFKQSWPTLSCIKILGTHICHTYQSILGDYLMMLLSQKSSTWALLNSKFAWYARHAMGFDLAVHSFSKDHFSSSIDTQNLPFCITLACNPYKLVRALFQEFTTTARVFGSGNDMLNDIRVSGETLVISGYLINSYWFCTSEVASFFWKLQVSIIAQLCLVHLLFTVMAMVIPDHDCPSVSVHQRPHCHLLESCISGHLLSRHWQFDCWFLYNHHHLPYTLNQQCRPYRAEDSACNASAANRFVSMGTL